MEFEEDLKYQLCRMFLVNAGTNKSLPSNRITMVDPRGGALVTGPNGVGKTMTLRLLPLFFGFPPNRLLGEGDGNRGGMVPFILPEESSAIAFEYQRGSEADLRLAVIRRDPTDPRAPFYRIFSGGWNQALFVQNGLFVTDEESTRQAAVKYSKKLTVAEYRSVILRTALQTKDRSIRGLQTEYSFSQVPLDNLDKLVASMVKDVVSFDDIKAVAVSLAQQNLGRTGENGRLTFRQRQAELHAWLSSNRGGHTVLEKTPDVEKLRASLERVNAAENAIRALWWDVNTLIGKRGTQVESKTLDLEALETSFATEEAAETLTRDELTRAVKEANGRYETTHSEHQALGRLRDRFARENVATWQALQPTLPGLKEEKNKLSRLIEAASAQHEDAVGRYRDMRSEAQEAHRLILDGLERSKSAPRETYDKAVAGIEVQAAAGEKDIRDQWDAQKESLNEKRQQLGVDRGQAQTRQQTAGASHEAESELRQAQLDLQSVQNELFTAQQNSARLAQEAEKVRQAFDAQEKLMGDLRQRVSVREELLASASALLAPGEGTLLHALRSHPGQEWKRDLAKVLDERLLLRKDLSPRWEEDGGALFGWAVDTDAVAAPGWSEDSSMREEVALCERALISAQGQLQVAQEQLGRLGEENRQAALVAKEAAAMVEILVGQRSSGTDALERAQQVVAHERKAAREYAASELVRINREISDIEGQISRIKTQLENDLGEHLKNTQRLKVDAAQARDAALSAIDRGIADAAKQLTKTIADIDTQEREHLSSVGVDTGKLTEMRADADKVAGTIREIETRESLIQEWVEYESSAGEARFARLEEALNTEKARHESSVRALSEHNRLWEERRKEQMDAIGRLQSTVSGLQDEIANLNVLLVQIGMRPASMFSTIDASTTWAQMSDRHHACKVGLAKAESELTSLFTSLQSALMAADPQVNKFVTDWMGQRVSAQASTSFKAQELIHCFHRIGPEFIAATNQHLRSILSNIGSLQKAIVDFEEEVHQVNGRLQEGLNQVKGFERIQDLVLNIEPTFEDLGFYKMLRRMGGAIRSYEESRHLLDETKPAPREIAAAVADFASVLGNDGNLDVDLASHITLSGSVRDNGNLKEFKRDRELAGISSNGLSAILRITLVSAIANTMRGSSKIHIPWVTDEIATFDGPNLRALLKMLAENRIDVITAAPDLDPLLHPLFAHRYLFQDLGKIRERHTAMPQLALDVEAGSAP